MLRIAESGASRGAVLAVPGIVLTPLGSVLGDRFSPVSIMFSANAARGVLMGAALALLVLTDVAGI